MFLITGNLISQTLHPVGAGVNANVYDLYAGGTDLYIACDTTNNTAPVLEWDGAYTSYPFPNMPHAEQVCYYGGKLMASFGSAEIWNGSTWDQFTGGQINDMQYFSGNLYAVGVFTDFVYYNPLPNTLSGVHGKAMYDGTNWNILGANNTGYNISCAIQYNNNIYFGGNITSNAVPNIGVVKWDPVASTYTQVGNALAGINVTSMAFYNGILYASGSFPGGKSFGKLIGSTWTVIPTGTIVIGSLDVFDNKLYTGGSGLNYYDGTTLTPMSGINGWVNSLTHVGNTLYIGGNFTAPYNHLMSITSIPQTKFSIDHTTICAGSCIAISDSTTGADTFAWSFPGANSTSSTSQAPGNVCYSTAGNYTITLVSTNQGGNSTYQIGIKVNANPVPVISAGSSLTFCKGDSVILSSNFSSGNAWSNSSANQSITVKNSGTYTLTATNTNGCFASVSSLVVVNGLPTIIVTGNAGFCQGDSVHLSSNFASTVWSNGLSMQSIYVSSAKTLTLTATDVNGCISTASITTTVYSLPAIPTISLSNGNLVSSSATNNQWYLNGAIINGATNNTYSPTQNGNYTVEVTNANGCNSVSAAYNFIASGINEASAVRDFKYRVEDGVLYITMDKAQMVYVFDMSGRLIYEKNATEHNVELQAAGMYIVRVGMNSLKIMK